MSLYEWRRLGATEQAIEDFNSDRAAARTLPMRRSRYTRISHEGVARILMGARVA